MPRAPRVVAVGVPHHITHRGNNRQDVFLSDEDRCRYQLLLRSCLESCRADLLGWCWMSNHVHLIVVPGREDSLARLIRNVHSGYAQDFNRRRSRDGHLWRSRFYSTPLGPDRLVTALLYVDLNPVRARMTGEAPAWEWSSARAHVEGRDESGLLAASRLADLGGCSEWNERLRRGQDAALAAELREATRTGRPFGDEAFQRRWGPRRPAAQEATAAGRSRSTTAPRARPLRT